LCREVPIKLTRRSNIGDWKIVQLTEEGGEEEEEGKRRRRGGRR